MKNILAVVVAVMIASVAFAADDLFKRIDQDGDGKISKQEYLDAMAGKFAKRDKNQDGVLTRDELADIDKLDVERFIQAADTDQNGAVIKKEFMDKAARQFHRMDKNADGHIDAKEWIEAHRAPKASMLILFTF